MSKTAPEDTEFIIVLPYDMGPVQKCIIREKFPPDLNITMIQEPAFPQAFYPANGLMVICGCAFDGKAAVPLETYRLIEHYKDFVGKKAWVPYAEISVPEPCEGWVILNKK